MDRIAVRVSNKLLRLKDGSEFMYPIIDKPAINRVERGDKLQIRRQDTAEDGNVILAFVYNSKNRFIQRHSVPAYILGRIYHTDNGYILKGDTPESGSFDIDPETAKHIKIIGRVVRLYGYNF